MSTQKLAILGSTGSIGTQALSLVEALGIRVTALSGHTNAELLEQQALRFRPDTVCASDPAAAARLKIALAHTDTRVLSGPEGLAEMAATADCDTVLTAVVGVAGLLPTIAAIEAGRDIALANKETLVAGGQLVTGLVKQHGVKILPVDSEHSAIFQCLQDAHSARALRRIFLTASGGPFFGYTTEQLGAVTPQQALRHPNWVMGRKITVDSATLMNKGLELIEAMWLFSLPPRDIEIMVHRQSIVHSMVEFDDGSVLAQLGLPDMRIPIQYALSYPQRVPGAVERLTPAHMSNLTFAPADEAVFRALAACRQAAGLGGTAPAAANAANEEAVALFLARKIGFLDIGEAVEAAVNSTPVVEQYSLDDLLALEREVRAKTRERLLRTAKP